MTLHPQEYLFVSDLDGTLLLPDGEFPREYVDRLNRLIDCGMNFTVATARNYDSAYAVLKEVNLKLPVILFNGVYLSDFRTGETVIMSGLLPRDTVRDLLSMASAMDLDPFVYTYGKKHYLYYRDTRNPASRHYLRSLEKDNRLKYTEDFSSMDGEASGFLFIDTHSVLAPFHDALAQKYPGSLNMYLQKDISKPGYYWLQVYREGSNKGIMLEQLARRLSFPLSRVVAFGDYVNDLDMFKVAGKSIAVANALPEVKNAATEVIGSHEQGAVIEYLESLGFG